MSEALKYANKLEALLRQYLKCHYTEFGVKANGNLLSGNWQVPIALALGCKYGQSGFDSGIKEEVDSFLGNEKKKKNINDIVENYEYYNFSTKQEVYEYFENTIKRLRELLA